MCRLPSLVWTWQRPPEPNRPYSDHPRWKRHQFRLQSNPDYSKQKVGQVQGGSLWKILMSIPPKTKGAVYSIWDQTKVVWSRPDYPNQLWSCAFSAGGAWSVHTLWTGTVSFSFDGVVHLSDLQDIFSYYKILQNIICPVDVEVVRGQILFRGNHLWLLLIPCENTVTYRFFD